jgi:hypothetical protein
VALSFAKASASGGGQGPFLKVAEVPLPDEPPEELEPPQAAHPSTKASARVLALHVSLSKIFTATFRQGRSNFQSRQKRLAGRDMIVRYFLVVKSTSFSEDLAEVRRKIKREYSRNAVRGTQAKACATGSWTLN